MMRLVTRIRGLEWALPQRTIAAARPDKAAAIDASPIILSLRGLSCNYSKNGKPALHNISLDIHRQTVTAWIGPSGCGKSTALRCINRLNDEISGCRVSGQILFHDKDIYDRRTDLRTLRTQIGMVFQKANCSDGSIFDNASYGLRIHGRTEDLHDQVEQCLAQAGLWDEVKDRLREPALRLSGGQQQRLCIARAIALKPEILLMDEPTSALDPIATQRIEGLIADLGKTCTVVIVTHSMQQAARISGHTVFFHMGEIIESGTTTQIFQNPRLQKTQDYIAGRFG